MELEMCGKNVDLNRGIRIRRILGERIVARRILVDPLL
jgi:hypothetical protein